MVVSPSFGQPWRPAREKINGPKSRNPVRSAFSLARSFAENGGVGRASRRGGGEGKDGCREKARPKRYIYYVEDVKVDATTPRNDLETSFALASRFRSWTLSCLLSRSSFRVDRTRTFATRLQVAPLEERTVSRLRDGSFSSAKRHRARLSVKSARARGN